MSEAADAVSGRAAPRATMRMQFNAGFTFDDACRQLDYVRALGISHVFASPILKARAGSTQGYDVIDHGSVNPELGGEAALRRLVRELRQRGMGLIVDVVPNHMAVGGDDNPRWLDLLEWGATGHSADFFDVDWDVPDPALNGKVLVPHLARGYGEALYGGDLRLRFDERRGRFDCHCAPHRFPIAPTDYGMLLRAAGLQREAAGFDGLRGRRGRARRYARFESACAGLARAASVAATRQRIAELLIDFEPMTAAGARRLHALLERQHYRLSWWRTAADEINWRRFFDIGDLAAVRVEDGAVFEQTHATIFRLYAEGLIDGVRIDHVDGLADPRGYCRRLRRRFEQLALQRPPWAAQRTPYLVVEKILAADERLAGDWHCDGSSGYSFMSEVSALLHDSRGEPPLTAMWRACSGGGDFAHEQRKARRRITQELFEADFAACARALHAIARAEPGSRDWSLAAIRRVLLELLVEFPVYRTYADARGRGALDAEIMRRAVAGAAARCRAGERPLLALIDRWLGGEAARTAGDVRMRRARSRALARFQQLTPPLAAKAVEDTAFYRHGRLLSRNEVGADPARFSLSANDFHRDAVQRHRRYPNAMLATATHDHKRGEDARARLAVLSEIPQRWQAEVSRWGLLNCGRKPDIGGSAGPDAIDEYILYQMLAGTWPPGMAPDDGAALHAWRQRLQQWQLKALREAKRHSGWTDPDEAYERACAGFLDGLLDPAGGAEFVNSLHAFVREIAAAGAVKSLTQCLLRMTAPGMPDLYQGTEFWDFSMVDPDNRRAVDYDARGAALRAGRSDAALLRDWHDGAVKQRLILRGLRHRAGQAALFAQGAYLPLKVEGAQARGLLAFARRHAEQAAIVIVPLLSLRLLRDPQRLELSPQVLREHRVVLPRQLQKRRWRHCLDESASVTGYARHIDLASALNRWPLALLAAEA